MRKARTMGSPIHVGQREHLSQEKPALLPHRSKHGAKPAFLAGSRSEVTERVANARLATEDDVGVFAVRRLTEDVSASFGEGIRWGRDTKVRCCVWELSERTGREGHPSPAEAGKAGQGSSLRKSRRRNRSCA